MDKLKSRKFWVAVVASIVGLVTTIWGQSVGDTVNTIAGAAITIATALGYLFVEGSIDKANLNK